MDVGRVRKSHFWQLDLSRETASNAVRNSERCRSAERHTDNPPPPGKALARCRRDPAGLRSAPGAPAASWGAAGGPGRGSAAHLHRASPRHRPRQRQPRSPALPAAGRARRSRPGQALTKRASAPRPGGRGGKEGGVAGASAPRAAPAPAGKEEEGGAPPPLDPRHTSIARRSEGKGGQPAWGGAPPAGSGRPLTLPPSAAAAVPARGVAAPRPPPPQPAPSPRQPAPPPVPPAPPGCEAERGGAEAAGAPEPPGPLCAPLHLTSPRPGQGRAAPGTGGG
ncbi:basic proline-rich protein-like [Myiozetetes cayanensis]|uniref:basic proline-rich protein-like n=1 Tax=Myiozetetes cayanensis TaxID=478635 RepID=UPI002160BB96|nr:basic proline-rich protein-like [Myiozetetes cayanensis]